jgi:periplasmic protein TonB
VRATEVEDIEPDTILEPDDAEVLEVRPTPPRKPTAPPTSPPAPAAGTSKFPWQPTSKPLAEPMASALRRAAEAAAKAEPTPDAPSMGPGFASAEDRLQASTGMVAAHGAAAAPAPAKEKPQSVASAAAPAPAIAKPAFHEAEGSAPTREEPPLFTPASTSTHDEVPLPTFFPGAYDHEEEEGGSKTKALIIVAAVILLACSAAFLSWRNMSGKNSPQTPSPQSAPAPAGTAPSSNVGKTLEPGASATEPEVSEITIDGGAGEAAKPSAKPSPTKPAVKESPAPTAPEPADEPEVKTTLIVKNDTRQIPKPATPSRDQETVQEPSLSMNAAPDAKALAGISTGPSSLPKPSQVIKVSQGVMEGLVLKRVQPHYPAQAMQMRIQGSVQLQATISKGGDITNLKVVSGDGILSRAAQEAVKQWKYKPYYLNGEPVEIQTQILVNFKLPN